MCLDYMCGGFIYLFVGAKCPSGDRSTWWLNLVEYSFPQEKKNPKQQQQQTFLFEKLKYKDFFRIS